MSKITKKKLTTKCSNLSQKANLEKSKFSKTYINLIQKIDLQIQILTKINNSKMSKNLETIKNYPKIHQHDPERFKLTPISRICRKYKLKKNV